MRFWQEGLLLLAVLWGVQLAGTWMQMRHYRTVMRAIADAWPDGCVGASAARGTFGRGAVAIVVAGPDRMVRQVFLMEGRTVFAKFHDLPQAAGRSLAGIAADGSAGTRPGRRKALAGAVAQVSAVLERQAAAAAPA